MREVRQHRPRAYQQINGVRKELASRYVLKGKHRTGIRVAAYDRSKTLVIDPVVSNSTYLGNGGVVSSDIAVDSAGNAYVTGYTTSDNFITTADAIKSGFGGQRDVFVAKLSAAGSVLIYSSYLGGSGSDFISSVNENGGGIAVDANGNIYVAGNTTSKDFPMMNPIQDALQGGDNNPNIFVVKIKGEGLGAARQPRVTSVSISGKKLIVIGRDFVAGSVILINGQPQSTLNDSASPATRLISKKAGRKIKPGESIMIRVKNPDGVLSDDYGFTKPAN